MVSTMDIVCRDNTIQIKYNKGKVICGCPILLAESLLIREAVMISIQEKL